MKSTDTQSTAHQSLLGQATPYCIQYNPDLLFPIPRQEKRDELNISLKNLPFKGVDVWTAYEVSWLNSKGKPVAVWAQFEFPAESPNLVESKSLKLYLHSFNGTRFTDADSVIQTWIKDLSNACGATVKVRCYELNAPQLLLDALPGDNLDDLDIEVTDYQVNSNWLSVASKLEVSETLNSHLLKSNCLVTGQPDWGSVVIRYQGAQIERAGLLKYLISFREHNEFHEQCVERIFSDIMERCQPKKLTVYARYVRRGGLDINPYRSNYETEFDLRRLVRQ